MKGIKYAGLAHLSTQESSFLPSQSSLVPFRVTEEQFANFYESRAFKSELFRSQMEQNVVGKEFGSSFAASAAVISSLNCGERSTQAGAGVGSGHLG